jgi:hypothetical protein
MALLDDVKVACRVTTTAFNNELTDLISAGLADLGITDISPDLLNTEPLPLVKRAVLTYCRMNFGTPDDGTYDRLKASYDEQKSQLLMSRQYREVSGDA